MARVRQTFYPGGGFTRVNRYHIEATVIAGQVLIRNAAQNTAGEVENPTTTAAADVVGLAGEAVTYSTTQSVYDGFPNGGSMGEEGTVEIFHDPFAVYDFPVAGGATAGTALATTAPANILTNTSADTTGLTVTAAEVGTVSFAGGLIKGRTGNNAGITRRISAHTNSTSTAVTVPFPRTIAVNDTFIRVPWDKTTQTVQLTSTFIEANGIIVFATGAPFLVTDVKIDIVNDTAVVRAIAADHQFNPA